MRGRCCLAIILFLAVFLLLGIVIFNRLSGNVNLGMPRLAEVPADLPAYDRADWGDWIDADDNCRNTRHEVLAEESVEPVSYRTDRQCRVATGRWIGPYTGQTFVDPSSLDVDHVVPACQRPPLRRMGLGPRPQARVLTTTSITPVIWQWWSAQSIGRREARGPNIGSHPIKLTGVSMRGIGSPSKPSGS